MNVEVVFFLDAIFYVWFDTPYKAKSSEIEVEVLGVSPNLLEGVKRKAVVSLLISVVVETQWNNTLCAWPAPCKYGRMICLKYVTYAVGEVNLKPLCAKRLMSQAR